MSNTDALTTAELVADVVSFLETGDVILGDAVQDNAAAQLLDALLEMHNSTGIDLERLPAVRAFAVSIVEPEAWDA